MGSSHFIAITCPWGRGWVKMLDLENFSIFWLCCRRGHPCFTNTCLVKLRITDEGSVPEMRIWFILLIQSNSKWCIHLKEVSFYIWNGLRLIGCILVLGLRISLLYVFRLLYGYFTYTGSFCHISRDTMIIAYKFLLIPRFTPYILYNFFLALDFVNVSRPLLICYNVVLCGPRKAGVFPVMILKCNIRLYVWICINLTRKYELTVIRVRGKTWSFDGNRFICSN